MNWEAAVSEQGGVSYEKWTKVRDRLQVPADISEERAKELALASDGAQKFMDGKTPRRVVYVAGRLVNIVV